MEHGESHDECGDVQETTDPLDHPWIDEMRQYEPIDETQKEAEAWF